MNPGVAMSSVRADRVPNSVVLFSGHMIDAGNRRTPRFPPDGDPVAAAAISKTLAEIGVTRCDLAICGGDGPGKTQHVMDEARRRTEQIFWLNIGKFCD
jgi:hypothetical protein